MTKKKPKKKSVKTSTVVKVPKKKIIILKTKKEQIDNYELRKYRLREELRYKILKLLIDFKSIEEPQLTIENTDVISVMASIIQRRTR